MAYLLHMEWFDSCMPSSLLDDARATLTAAPDHSSVSNLRVNGESSLAELCRFICESIKLVSLQSVDQKLAFSSTLLETVYFLLNRLALDQQTRSNPDVDLVFHMATVLAEEIIHIEQAPDKYIVKIKGNNDGVTALLSAVCLLSGRLNNLTLAVGELLEPTIHEQLLQLRQVRESVVPVEPSAASISGFTALPEVVAIPSMLRSGLQLTSCEAGEPNKEGTVYCNKETVQLALVRQAIISLITKDVSLKSDDAVGIFTASIIGIARVWNALPSSEAMDKVAAHALLHLLPPAGPMQLLTLRSAAFTAIVPIAMRLLDRYHADLHALGALLLLRAASATPPGLLATFQEWILPHLFTYLEIVSEEWPRLLVARLLHTLLACDPYSSVTLQHAHMYLETSIKMLLMKPSPDFAWPFLLHLTPALRWLPEGVLAAHQDALLDCFLQLLNVWHLPMQNLALQGMSALSTHVSDSGCAAVYAAKIATELLRLLVFYRSNSNSGQRDISGAGADSVAVFVANCRVTAGQWRALNETAWDTFLTSVAQELEQPVALQEAAAQSAAAGNHGSTRKVDVKLQGTAVDRVRDALTILQGQT